MDDLQKQWLADFSLAVRESTLKRLRIVPQGLENWKYKEGKMSIADMAFHIIQNDEWLLKTLSSEHPLKTNQNRFIVHSRSYFDQLIDDLETLGEERASLIRTMGPKDFKKMYVDPRTENKVSAWWLIVRANLDHEIHHRGQISILLSLLE